MQPLDFINKFNLATPSHSFTNGYCYYFAQILLDRFPSGVLYYHHTNHFLVLINSRLYDASGDVTEKYNDHLITTWDDLRNEDVLLFMRIVRDCILI